MPLSAQYVQILDEMAAAGQLSGVNPLILQGIAQEESSGEGATSPNSAGYGGFFGLGLNKSYPGGTATPGILNSTDADNFRLQAVMAAGAFAQYLQQAGGNVDVAENIYQTGQAGNSAPGIAVVNEYLKGGAATTGAGSIPPTGAGSASPSGAGAAAAPAATGASTVIGGQTYNLQTTQEASALATISATLGSYGFSGTQLQNLTTWAWGEISSGVDPSQVPIDLQNPNTVGGQIFAAQFPYFHEVNQSLEGQGQQPLDPATYMQLTQSYEQQAQAAGLPTGMVTGQGIATLMMGNVSPQEFSTRLNTALTLAYQSTPAMQAAFNQYFGQTYAPVYSAAGVPQTQAPGGGQIPGQPALSVGQLAALALDPNIAEPLLAQQVTAAQLGGASVTSGVGSLDPATAQLLAQSGITLTQQTLGTLQNLAPYSALETARPGMGGEAAQGTVSSQQLVTGAFLGNPQAQRQLQTAEEVAKAPFTGGGGFVSNAKGATGTGSASGEGAGNT